MEYSYSGVTATSVTHYVGSAEVRWLEGATTRPSEVRRYVGARC
jgi:hypothetical protein